MTADHLNAFWWGYRFPALFAAGRLALPLFVLVLAYNLARPGALARGAHGRAAARMAAAGLLATPFFVALGGPFQGAWPLDAMFLLALIAGVTGLLAGGGPRALAAGPLFAAGGALVEYFWVGALLGVAAWSYCGRPSRRALALLGAALAGLCWLNGNPWALAALPLAGLAARFDLALPRLRWAFYAYYPAHLAALWLLRESGLAG
ncbi:MAG: conjugal transfer protein TraX [bacterium]|nr:conjugal transfer protein TraX [bacterium]